MQRYACPYIVYNIFHVYREIESFWEQRYLASSLQANTLDVDIKKFEDLWLINYSALFGLVLSIISLRAVTQKILSFANLGFNTIVLAAFLTTGLVSLAELRYSYLNQTNATMFARELLSHIGIRYVCLLFVLPLIWANANLAKKDYFHENIRQTEKTLIHIFMIVLLSSELVHWLDMRHIDSSDKLALSILWSIYALGLIVWGLQKKERLLRILAIILFGITLIKLFAHDIADMSTISKTIVMMTLGVLLLAAAFLYNKVKKSAEEGG